MGQRPIIVEARVRKSFEACTCGVLVRAACLCRDEKKFPVDGGGIKRVPAFVREKRSKTALDVEIVKFVLDTPGTWLALNKKEMVRNDTASGFVIRKGKHGG